MEKWVRFCANGSGSNPTHDGGTVMNGAPGELGMCYLLLFGSALAGCPNGFASGRIGVMVAGRRASVTFSILIGCRPAVLLILGGLGGLLLGMAPRV